MFKINKLIWLSIFIILLSTFLLNKNICAVKEHLKFKDELISYSKHFDKTYTDNKNITEYRDLVSIFDKEYQSKNELLENSIVLKLKEFYNIYYSNPSMVNNSMGIVLKGDDNISYIKYTKLNTNDFSHNKLYSDRLLNSFISESYNRHPIDFDSLLEFEMSNKNLSLSSYSGEYTFNIENNQYKVSTIDFFNISDVSINYIEKYFKSNILIDDLIEISELKATIKMFDLLVYLSIFNILFYLIVIYNCLKFILQYYTTYLVSKKI